MAKSSVQSRVSSIAKEKLDKENQIRAEEQKQRQAKYRPDVNSQQAYNSIMAEVTKRRNAAANIRQVGREATSRMLTGEYNPVANRLKQGVYTDIQKNLNGRIENEQHIINDQGREKNDPAVLRAQETLTDMLAKKADNEEKLRGIQGHAFSGSRANQSMPRLTYSPEENEYIRKLRESGNSIRNIPMVYNDRAKQMIHMRDASQVVDEDTYVQWLMQAANAGMMKPEEEANARRYAFYHGMPDAANSREYSEYLRKGIESGMFDNDGDLSLMSTGKLQSELADFKRRKAQAEANSRNKDEINSDLYETMGQRGIYKNLEVNGLYDPYTQQYHMAKPEDYNEWDVRNGSQESTELSTYYDSLLYDSIHGQGAYNNILNNGTDAEFDAADAEIQELWDRLENGTIGQLGDQYNDRISELQGAAYGGESNLDREIRKRQEELTRRQTINQYNDLEGAEYNPDLIDPETAAGYKSELIRLQDEGGAPANNKTEWLYWIINNISDKEQNYGGGFLGELTGVQQAEQGYRKYSFMTPEMIGKFNALYEAGKTAEAQAFMDAIDPYITQLASGRAEELRYNASKGDFGGLYGAMTILRQPIAGLSGTMGSLAALMGNEDAKNPNSGWYKWQKMNNTTRGARAEAWGDFFADKFGEQYRGAGEWLNGVTYSIADNIMAMVLTKGAGKAFGYEMSSKAAERMIQFVMSSSAASSSMVDKISQGMDPTEAALYAVGNGMIEAITEKYSIEALLKPNVKDMLGDWKKVGKFLLKNTIAEGTEEGASDVLNTVWDEVLSGIYGHESELSAQYNELIAQGMSPKDATRQVLRGWLANTGSDMLAGALSGFVMSGGRTAMNTVNQQKAGAKIRSKSNTTAGKTGVEQLIEAARGMDESTESRRMAEELNEKVQSGKKVSSGEAGRLAQNILYETNETMGNIARDTVERMVRDTMKENGATPEQIERTAGIVTDAVVKNKKLTKGEMATVAEVKQAIEAYRHLMTNEGKLEAGMTVRMNPEGDVTRSVRETVGRLLNGESTEKVDHRISRDIMQGVQSMVLANDEDLANVQNGKRTKTGMDAIVDNEIVQVTGKEGDSYIVKTADGTEKKVSAAAVTAVDTMAGAIMAYTEGNGRSVLGDEAFGTIAKGAEENKKMAPAKYIAEAMKIYMAARTGGQMPGTTLAESTAQAIWNTAQNENRQATKDRQAAGQLNVEAGKGTANFDGAEYGTDVWKEKIKGLSKQIRNQMGAVAEYAKRIGLHVDFINDPENEAIFGSEDRSTGRITINVAGREADLKVGGKTVLGENHHLLVVAAHEFTHWLEQNSTESYDELRQFIFDKIRSRGQSVEALVMNKIDAYRSVAKQDLSIEDAMAEIVADACDQVLGSEKVAREIEQSNPNLYSKIKSFVTNLVARIRAAAAGMSTSASAEARMLQGWADELEDRWLKTLEEAQGREKETQNKEKTASDKQLSIRNISEKDQAYADAVERGDMETAQRMVDQAAKAAGYTRKVYHGTPNGGFNTFRNWSYFTENKDYAERYQSSSASSIRSIREGEGNRQVYELYMNPGKEFDTRKAKERKLFNEARMEYGLTSLDNMSRGLPDWTDGRDIIEYIEDNGLDYDTVILDEGADGGYGEEVRDRGISYVTKANMVKSAAPVVYDDAGNVIPLSERFDQEQQDIRYSVRQRNEDVSDWKTYNVRDGEMYMKDQKGNETKLTGLDREYVEAWKKHDFVRMEEILADKIRENGAIPFKTPNSYSAPNHKWIANAIKEGNTWAINQAAAEMAQMVPKNAVLIPMPNHHGETTDDTDTVILANKISEISGRPVIRALAGIERESRKEDKAKPKSQQMKAEDLGFRQVEEIPEGTVPYFVDNVIASGLTAEAAHRALGNNGVTLAYAKSTRSANDGLKRANVTFYDTNKQYGSYLIPLSERIEMSRKGYAGTKFSMQAPVEQNADGLVAVHNMHLSELMGTLEEGGVTAPSIAVILARTGHSKYGNVSLVFKPSAIDPMKSRRNMVYGADAYTPERAHARVEQEIVTPEVKKAIKVVKGLLEGMDGNFEHAVDNWFNQYLYDDDTYYSLTEIARTGYTNIGMLAAYQKSKGNNVEPVFMNVPTSRAKTENEQDYGKLIDGLFDRGLYEQFFTDYDNAESHNGFSPAELREKYAGIFKDILKETNRRWEVIKLENPGMMEKIFTSNWFNEFYDYNKKGIGDVKKFDEYETKKALQGRTNEDDLTDWLAGVIRNTLGQKGIRNNKDTFTNIGNRRSFKALHDEYTTENVVKAMYKNAQQKGEGADYFQGLMATASKEYKNLKEVKADAGRLEIMDQEKYDAYIAQKSREMNELAEELSTSNPRVAREALLEAGKRYARNQTPEVVKRAFAAAGYNLTNEQLNKALDLIKEAREYKTGYFEAKPERVMNFDEIARVILPESVKDEPLYKQVLDMLDERGIPYDTYDGTDEDRLKKLNSVKNVQFSVRQIDDAYMRAARTGDIETMDALVKEAAERAGFDTSRAAYHGTMSFGFTEFDMDDMQSEIFVSYNPELAASYTENDEFKQIHEGEKRPNLKKMKAEDLADYLMEVVRKTGDKSITGIEYLGEDNEGGQQFKTSYILESTGRKKESIITRENVYRMINRRFVTSGIYSLYTRPGKRLVIDAHGSDWNEVVVFDTNYPIDIAGYFNIKDSYGDDVFTTRQIAEFARSKGYDSVEIKNVYDDGMMNDNLDRGRKGKLKGDIAIFFNPNDVKSADTITYDDDGSIIPPSERFSDDSNDLRFSIRQGDMEINRWMQGLTASSLQTEQERTMLKQWQETMGSLNMARHAVYERRAELEKLEAKPNPTAYDKHEIAVKRSQLEAWQKKADRYETSLAKATSEKGFAAIMRKQSKIMTDLVNGRTADEVRGTVDAINAELETVQKEMEERSERLKQLAAKEAVIRIRQQLNSAGLKRIAAKLKGDLNSELSNTEIENRLALMALKMKEGKIDEADVTELADMLIGKMRRTYDSYILDELRGRTITMSKSQQAELKGQNRTIREIRQELAGTGIRIDTKGGNTLDKNWSELCDLIPALDKEAADKDMLDQLLNVIAAEKEAARNQYTANMDMEVASMVIDAASNLVPEIVTDKKSMQLIRETLNFIAEMSTEAEESARAMEELNSLMTRLQKKGREAKATLGTMESNIQDAIAYNNELSLQSEQANWLTERHKLIDQLKSEHTQEMLRQQAEFRLRIEKDKTARGLMNENMALRRKIHTNISRIRNLLMKESVKQNIPEHMKGLAREMLDRIVRNDMSGRKITGMDLKMLQETRRVLDAWEKQDGKYNPDELKGLDEAVQDAIHNALEDIRAGIDFYNASTRGSELQVNLQAFKNALTRISDGVSAITGIINAERGIALGDRRVAVEDQAYKVQESAGDKRAKELTGSLGRTIAALRKAITSGNLTPEYFFKMLKNAGLDDLWEEYHRAENRNGLELAKSKAKLDEIAQKYGYKNWDTDARQEVKLASGSVNMTIGQIMSLYATWKREHTLGPAMSQHLQNGGFYVEEYDPRKGIIGRRVVDLKAHRVTEADMEMVNSLLTDEQKKFVDDIVAYMSTDMSELGNEASMKAYGIRMYKENYYFPFKMWDGIKARASNDSGSAAAANDRAFHPSFSKTRLHGANNALMLGDFMTTAADHIVGMINYATMGLANENLQKVLNAQVPEGERLDQMTRRTIRTVLEEAYGRAVTEYLAKLQEQLNGGAVRVDRTVYDRMLTLFRKNAVAGSMSVALQQPLSYIRAAMMINPKYMTEALAREYWKGSYQERLKHSGVSVIKDMGRFDMGFGQGAREYITPEGKEGKARQVWDAITDKATILPELMDRWTWNRLWVAVKAEQHAQHPDMDVHSDEFLDMAGERFNDIVRKTQVYDSTLTKSQNMRSQNPFVKSITSFMAEPTLSLNVLADAVQNAKEKGGKAKLAKALATFALSAMAQAAAKALMSTGRTPDDKKTWMENYLYRYYANLINEGDPLNLIPGYNDMITLLKNGKLEDDAMGVIGKLFTAGDKLAGAFKEGAGYRDIEDSFGQIVQLFTQLPAKNIMRDLRAMYNWFIGKPYADRQDSAAVIRLQTEASLMTADNLIGVISAKLGEAGYKVTNSAYYDRMYNAIQSGNKQEAEAIREYLTLGKGVKEETIDSNMRTMTRNGNLFPALEANKAAEIAKAIKELQEYGSEVKDIKSAITKEMKQKYLAADSAGKVKIRDAIQKAYRAMGLTAEDADKVINGWKDE